MSEPITYRGWHIMEQQYEPAHGLVESCLLIGYPDGTVVTKNRAGFEEPIRCQGLEHACRFIDSEIAAEEARTDTQDPQESQGS